MTPFRLLAITPPTGPVPGDILDRWLAAEVAIPGTAGVGLAVLLRDPALTAHALLTSDRLAPLRRRCRDHAIPLILSVAPDAELPPLPPDIAGLHLRGDPTPAQLSRPVPKGSLLRGRSCHGLPQPGHDQVDYTLFAPVFTPTTSPGKAPVGLAALQAWTRDPQATIFALGGVTPATAPACLAAGAHGLAGIGVFFGEPAQVEQDVAALRDLVAAHARHVEPLPPR